VIHTIVFFGASSSQAVHPDRASPADLAASAARDLISDGRDFALAAAKTGARIGATRMHFKAAKEAIDAKDPAGCTRAVVTGITALEVGSAHASENLRDGAAFMVACEAATAAGVDTRDAAAIFEASVASLVADARCFGAASERLSDAIAHAMPSAQGRTGEILKILAAPRKALEIAGVA